MIAQCNIGLDYVLLVASNSHISTSHPLLKNVNDSKSYVLAVPMIMSFKVSGKISFFLFASRGNEISNWKK